MSLRSAKPVGSARVAVVGAETVAGVLIRQALEERRIPGRRVDLYGATHGDAVLSEYAGEARLIQEPEPEEVAGHEVIFVCDQRDDSHKFIGAATDSLVIEVGRGDGPGADRRLVHMRINGTELNGKARHVFVPHPLGLMLADILHPLEREFGIRHAAAVVLRPASDFGDRGVEELRKQTVSLLNFAQLPREVFGAQLAFNLIPQRSLPDGDTDLETSISAEIARLLGWDRGRLSLMLVAVPVFYGHGVNLQVTLDRTATSAEVKEALSGADSIDVASNGKITTPIEVTGEKRITISELREDGVGGFWIWVVAGEAAAAAAEHAVELAEAVIDL